MEELNRIKITEMKNKNKSIGILVDLNWKEKI